MKSRNHQQSHLLNTLAAIAFCATASHAGTVNTTFSFQKGDLRQDGNIYVNGAFDGASYAGVLDGQINDNNTTGTLSTGATSALGNAYAATPSGNNGRQYVGLFSYDLTELNNFIAANTSVFSSVVIQSVSFKLVSAGSVSGTAMALNLYGTDPFTSSGCTWSNYTTGTPWTVPYQNIGSTAQFGYTGGGSALTPSLGGSNPTTGVTSGNPLTWGSSANFIAAVTNALAQTNKTLYLTARGSFFNNGDNRLSVNFSPATTVDSRPELLVTLSISSQSDWTGATSNSWNTGSNWTKPPGAGDNIRFNSSSTANLDTVVDANFDVIGIALTTPSGPVSIGGTNTLTVGARGFDLSAATQDLTISAPVVLGVGQSWTVGASRTLNANGGISGASPLTITGAGKVSLGAAATHTGTTTISSGATLRMGAANVLPNGATSGNLAVIGTLDLNGFPQSVNALTGSGTVDNTGVDAVTLTVGNNNAGGTFSGIIQETDGAVAVVKTGTGGLTLTGASTYSGGFTNNGAGDVTPNNNAAFGSGPVVSNAGQLYATATTTFANTLALNNSTLRVGGGNSRTITWNGPVTATGASGLNADGGTAGITLGSTLDIAGATFSSYANGTANTIVGDISGTDGNLKVTGGTLQLAGDSTYTGTTTLSGSGVLRLQAGGTILSSGNVEINTSGSLNIRNTEGWVYAGTITGDGTGSVNPNSATNVTLAGSISGVASVVAGGTGTNATVSGNISGAAAVTVQGGATLTLSGDNSTMTGTVTVNGGTANTRLNLKSATALGTGTLAIGGGNNGRLDNTSGSALMLSTGNAQAWDSDFTFVGTHDLDLGAGAVTLGGNRAVSIQANTLTVSGAIGGAYGLIKAGAGTLALTGTSAYTGNTTVQGGTLTLGAAGSITASSSLTLNAGATLDASAQPTYAIPAGQPVAFGINAADSGSSGRIAAAVLDISNATVSYTTAGSPDDPVYVLATYTSLTGASFLPGSVPPIGYEVDYDYEGNKIALVKKPGYPAWQAANSTTGGLDADHDHDGVDNGTEYFLFGAANTTGFTALPGVTNTGGSLSVTWTKAADYAGAYGTDFVVETSATLADPWVSEALGGTVTITGNEVKYTFPAGTVNFARLKVTGP